MIGIPSPQQLIDHNRPISPVSPQEFAQQKALLGLTPRPNMLQARKLEIVAAINRYSEANMSVPQAWLCELNDIMAELTLAPPTPVVKLDQVPFVHRFNPDCIFTEDGYGAQMFEHAHGEFMRYDEFLKIGGYTV